VPRSAVRRIAIDALPLLSGAGTGLALELTSLAYELTILDNPHLPACVAQAVLDRIEARHEERQSGNDDSAGCP
jgi:hypothetical protein